MLIKLLMWVGVLRPYFDIYFKGDLYMRRWWVWGDDQARDAGKNTAGVHHIVRPDRCSDNHNHPCTFFTLRLWRWYVERLPKSQKQDPALDATEYVDRLRLPFTFSIRRASDRHTIVKVAPGGCWTLVIWFKKQGSWGFFTKAGYVPWREYEGTR